MEFKSLISFYIDMKLRKSGLIHNRNKVRVPDDEKDILQAALSICAQMEHDDRFADVLTSFRKFGITKETFLTVLDQLLVGDLNWARVLSVVSLSGELAVQCMENNEEHKIDFIQDWASSFAEVKLEHWIETHGGMVRGYIYVEF